MRFTVLRSKAVHVRFVTNNITLHQKTKCLQHVNGKFKIQCFGRYYTVFLDFLSAQNMFGIIGGKIVYWKWSEWKQKLLRDSRRFGLPRVRVAEGKNYGKRMEEIKGKSILVWVSWIRLYSEHDEYQFRIFSLFFLKRVLSGKNYEDTTILAFLSLSGIYFY